MATKLESADADRPKPTKISTRDPDVSNLFSDEFLGLYEVVSHRGAAQILASGSPELFGQLVSELTRFRISTDEIVRSGGNKSNIAKRLEQALNPLGWTEARLSGDLHITKQFKTPIERTVLGGPRKGQIERRFISDTKEFILEGVVDGHKIDFVKDRIAFDLEWNSKDQTFDRDLYAMRTFHDCGFISAGILLTRSSELKPLFAEIAPRTNIDKFEQKFGASTTWMGKLAYRLNAGRAGGCPILALGFRPAVVADFNVWKIDHPILRDATFKIDEPEGIPPSEDEDEG